MKLQAQHALVASRQMSSGAPSGPVEMPVPAAHSGASVCVQAQIYKPPAPGAFPKKELGSFEEKTDRTRTTLQDRRQAKCGHGEQQGPQPLAASG